MIILSLSKLSPQMKRGPIIMKSWLKHLRFLIALLKLLLMLLLKVWIIFGSFLIFVRLFTLGHIINQVTLPIKKRDTILEIPKDESIMKSNFLKDTPINFKINGINIDESDLSLYFYFNDGITWGVKGQTWGRLLAGMYFICD